MLTLIGEHLVTGMETMKELEIRVEDLISANNSARLMHYPIELGANITLYLPEKDGKSCISNVQEGAIRWCVSKSIARLQDYNLRVFFNVGKCAGGSLSTVLFNPGLNPDGSGIVGVYDMDIVEVREKGSLEKIINLGDLLKRENKIYGIGAYDFAIRLGIHDKANDMRIIHESFFALVVGANQLVPHNKPRGKPNDIHKEIGQPTTSVYMVNHAHENYIELLSELEENRRKSDLHNSFTMHYFLPMLASEFGGVLASYISARENKFYISQTESEEIESVKNLIKNSTFNLGKTVISGRLRRILQDLLSTDIISQYYSKSLVEEVKKIMLKAINKSHSK